MRVRLVAEAARELEYAARYYAEVAGPDIAAAFIAEVEAALDLLRAHPKIGVPWRAPFRRLRLGRFPFGILYDLPDDGVRVVAFAHDRRHPDTWSARER